MTISPLKMKKTDFRINANPCLNTAAAASLPLQQGVCSLCNTGLHMFSLLLKKQEVVGNSLTTTFILDVILQSWRRSL
jgi:hypothetical protein